MKILKTIAKRIVALGLAAVLIANSVPVTALADPETMSFAALQAQFAAGGEITLTRDYVSEGTDTGLEIPSGKNVTLDLNDHYILYKGNTASPVITVNGGLTLKDSKTTGRTTRYVTLTEGRATNVSESGTLSATCIEVTGGFIAGGNNVSQNGGGVYVKERCMFTMEGGTIAGCKAGNGGGVNVNNSGTFTMEDGTIVGCKALSDGGGVFINNTGNFNMNGGSIKNCTATGSGDKRGGGSVYVSSSGKFNMESGSITDCTADSGGGVYVYGGKFNMEGGSITDCTATSQGGGVYVYGGTFKICGAPVIRDNKKGSDANNVALNNSKYITVTGELTTGAEIRVAASKDKVIAKNGTPSDGNTAYTITADDAAKFHSDDTSLCPALYDGNVVLKDTLPTATLDNNSMVYNGSNFNPTISFEEVPLTKDSDYTISYKKVVDSQEIPLLGAPKDVGNYKLVITGKGGYAGNRELSFTIEKADITSMVTAPAARSLYYNGLEQELVSAGTVADNAGTTWYTLTGDVDTAPGFDGYSSSQNKKWSTTVPAATDAGTYYVWYMVKGDSNHSDKDPSKISVAIARITIANVEVTQKSRAGDSGSVSILEYVKTGGTLGSSTVYSDADGILDEHLELQSGTVSYSIKSNANAGSTATIHIPVTGCTNYIDYTIKINIKATEKNIPTVTVSPINVTYTGNAVNNSSIRGTAKYGDVSVPGTWAFKTEPAQRITNVVDSGTKQVVFTPNDTTTCETVETSAQLVITKANVTGEPSFNKITTDGKTLADVGAVIDTMSPSGALGWELPLDTAVTANTSFAWIYTPDDTNNYNVKKGSTVLWVKSSSGGGSSSGGSSGGSGVVPPADTDKTAVASEDAKTPSSDADKAKENASADAKDKDDKASSDAEKPIDNKDKDVETITSSDGSVTVKETVTSSDGSKIEKETTTELDGTKTDKETIIDKDGNKTVLTEVTSKDGSSRKTVEINNKDGSSEKTVETVGSDGTKVKTVEVVKTNGTTEKSTEIVQPNGTTFETSETVKVNGDTNRAEKTTKPNGDYNSIKESTTGNAVSIVTGMKSGKTKEEMSFGAKGKKASVNKVSTNSKSKTVTIPSEVVSFGVKYKVTTLKKGMFKGSKTKPMTVKMSAKSITKVEKGAFNGLAKKGTIKVSGSEKDFKKLKKMLKKSGLSKSIKVIRVK